MKKWVVISVLVATTIFGATYVSAAATDGQSPANTGFSFEQMFEACKQAVNNFVNNGTLTPDQGKNMNDQMSNMAPIMKNMMGNSSSPMGQPGMMGQGSSNSGTSCF